MRVERVRARCAQNVKQRLWQEHAKRGLPGKPFVSCARDAALRHRRLHLLLLRVLLQGRRERERGVRRARARRARRDPALGRLALAPPRRRQAAPALPAARVLARRRSPGGAQLKQADRSRRTCWRAETDERSLRPSYCSRAPRASSARSCSTSCCGGATSSASGACSRWCARATPSRRTRACAARSWARRASLPSRRAGEKWIEAVAGDITQPGLGIVRRRLAAHPRRGDAT